MTHMRLLIISITMLSLLGLAGCENMFEKEMPPHNLVDGNVITDETTAEPVLNGVYAYLEGIGTFDVLYILDDEYRLGLFESGYRVDFEENQLLTGDYRVEDSYILNAWEDAYTMINAANNFISIVEELPENSFGPNRQTEMLAEAKFLRAFGYSFLLKRFGYFWDINSEYGVLLRLEPSTLSNNNMSRSTVKACYDQIMTDYQYAIDYGPDFYSRYRACATTAKAFKAEMLMNRGEEGDYEEAIRLADEVLKSSEFSMATTFEEVFSTGYDSQELLFTRHISDQINIGDNIARTSTYLGEGRYQPSDLYYDFLPETDTRRAASLDSIIVTETDDEKTLIYKKHLKADNNSPMYYMRLAQMHLIKAEAMAYTNQPTADAIEELNVLRRRSGNTELNAADYPTQESLLDEIFAESVREIGIENGSLFYFAVRYKKGNIRKLQELNPNYTSANENQLCFPIPEAELEHNFEIEQRPL